MVKERQCRTGLEEDIATGFSAAREETVGVSKARPNPIDIYFSEACLCLLDMLRLPIRMRGGSGTITAS